MTDVDAWQLLDALEKASAVWSQKRDDQDVLDQLKSVDISLDAISGAASTLTFGLIGSPSPSPGPGGPPGRGPGVRYGGGGGGRGGVLRGSRSRRAGELGRRIDNAAALRRVLYARYPSVGLTSLESMKTRRNEDTALAVLEAYARSLTRTAAQLRERARDVVYAHYSAIGRACPLDGPGPRTPDLMGRVMRTARLVTEWAYDLGRAARLETEALVGIRAADVSNLACCGGTPPPSLAREKERAASGGAI